MAEVVIGVDCATQARNVGLARATWTGSSFAVTEAVQCGKGRDPLDVVLEWMEDDPSALLALDAPLGWPSALGRSLASHRAGEVISVPSELLFRRLTDRVVTTRTGKTPLDIGANLIARTAHWTLLFLHHLRGELDEAIPVAWSAPLQDRIEVIEVYPAATLLAHGASIRGYKKPAARSERAGILDVIGESLDCSALDDSVLESSDTVDAVSCALAGVDFLRGEAVEPSELEVAKREGWIWFRDPAGPSRYS